MAYDEIVDEALCFGWVDSQPRALDAERSMRRLSPRGRTSNWSKVNKDKVERLIAAGQMTKAGLALVEQANRMAPGRRSTRSTTSLSHRT